MQKSGDNVELSIILLSPGQKDKGCIIKKWNSVYFSLSRSSKKTKY